MTTKRIYMKMNQKQNSTTEQQIIEGNWCIAKFKNWNYATVEQFIEDESSVYLHDYHREWNKLMEVVEKVNTLGFFVNVYENHCKIGPKADASIKARTYRGTSRIDSVWNAVIKFIKWYNQQPKSEI